MSFPLKNNPEQANDFIYNYIQTALADSEAYSGWSQLNMTVGINVTDLDLGYTLKCFSEGTESFAEYPENPDAGLILSSDTFHRLFTGKANVMLEFAKGKVKTVGDMGGILKIVNLLPQNIKIYKEFLSSQGY